MKKFSGRICPMIGKRSLTNICSALLLLLASAGFLCAEPVTTEDVADLAEGWLSESSNRMKTKLPDRIRKIETFTSNDHGEIFHIVFLEPTGYIVISPDNAIEPIIAFSDKGTPADLTENHPLMSLLRSDLSSRKEKLEEPIASAGSIGSTPLETKSDRNKQKWLKYTENSRIALSSRQARSARRPGQQQNLPAYGATGDSYGGSSSISDVRISPLLQTEWSQKQAQSYNCYNYYTPNNYYAGCVATAMAQIMKYDEYPNSGIGEITKTITVDGSTQSATTRGGDGSGGAYNWSLMPLIPASATYKAYMWEMIGALCYDAGVGAEMNYTSSGSTAQFGKAQDSMTDDFGYGQVKRMYNSNGINSSLLSLLLKSNLAADRPVFLGIRRSEGGHAVVCDGWGYSSDTEYHHINMGWGGSSDAWYNLPLVDTSSHTYDSVDSALFNIFTNGVGEVLAGRVIDSSSNGIAGASISVTPAGGGTTYTDTTDTNGYYGVQVPSDATYNIEASYSGRTSTETNAVVGTTTFSECGNLFADDITFSTFSFSVRARTYSAVLSWTDPLSIGMSNQMVTVRWKSTGYPTNNGDGTLLYAGSDQTVTHTNLTPYQNYYYRIAVTHNGSDFEDPSGTNLTTATPQHMPVKLFLRTSETTGSGADTKAACRAISWDKSGTGVINDSQPDDFTFKTKWSVKGAGNFNPHNPGDEVVLQDSVGTLFTLHFESDGSLGFDSEDTNSFYWTAYNVGSDYETNNPSAYSIDTIADINGDGMDELVMRSSETSMMGGLEKSEVRILFYDDNSTSAGKLADISSQPEGFNLATRWVIEGAGIFNNQSVPGSPEDSDQLLLSNTENGALFIVYLKDDGTINFESDNTNHVSWTSWNAATDFETNNPAQWSIHAVGDINGDEQDEIIMRSSETLVENDLVKSKVRVLLYDNTGATPGKLRPIDEQPASFNLANKWTIQAADDFNSSTNHLGEELLIDDSNGNFFLIYFNDNGTLEFDAEDTNSVYWTSFSAGTNYSDNAGNWSIQAVGDLGGDKE